MTSSERRAHFSDLDALRQSARRLVSTSPPPASAPPPPAASLPVAVAAVPTSVPVPTPVAVSLPPGPVIATTAPLPTTRSSSSMPGVGFGGAAFGQLVQQGMTLAGAVVGFVVDAQGLIVARQGRVADEDAQALGARLVMALDQAARMGQGFGAGQADVVVVAVGRGWLSGVRRRVPEAVTIGVFGVHPLGASQAEVLAEALKAFDPLVTAASSTP
jgi:hypothetical protein